MAAEKSHKYDDMIHMDYQGVQHHPRMSISRRAAQFSKFATLDDDVEENEIETDDFSVDVLSKQVEDDPFVK